MSKQKFYISVWLFLSLLLYAVWGFDNGKAVQVILGEAADQPFWGKVAVGEVIRQRGKVQGFSSMNRDLKAFYFQQPISARNQAWLAWLLSRYTWVSQGADHFDNVREFGEPSWSRNMKKTVSINGTQFYKS